MKEPRPRDLVLHNYHFSPAGKAPRSYLCGFSIVASNAKVRIDEPPSPRNWGNRGEYYRIELDGYTQIGSPLDFKTFWTNYSQGLGDEIEHHHPGFFPFTISGGIVRINQGMYLTIVTGILYFALCDALGVESVDIPDKER
jgi:hypothetical protein